MLNIDIKSIPDADQRYNTVGDYQEGENHELSIHVSRMSDWRYELLVAFHELIEASLCRNRNIADEDIDAFDIEYENNRQPGNILEPGDDPQAPYYKEHQFANTLEKMLADEMEVDWNKYSQEIETLNKK